MPEGDALHRIAARLQPLVGERVQAESPHPRGLATGVARVLDGRVLESVDAVGKHLLLSFEGGVVLRSHLRMSGRWRLDRLGVDRRGLPWLVLRGEQWQATQWNGPVLALDRRPVGPLGPDLLAVGTAVSDLVPRLRATDPSRLVGEALLDQRLVAGIGNMWLAEALWHAHLSPWRRIGEVGDDELETALDWAQDHMRAAVAGQRSPRAVYRRAGRPCPRCGTSISSRGLGDANRTAYWCPVCQPDSGASSGSAQAAVVAEAVTAIEAKDWTRLRRLLHPYVHWSDEAGQVRGRTNALAHLADLHTVGPPAQYELRDGQIYRWRAAESGSRS